MADYIEVNMSTLGQDIQEMESTLRKVTGDMNEMFNAVNELDAMWDGPANRAFVEQFLKDKQMFEEMSEAISGVIDSMQNARQSYKKCEAGVSEEIDRIRV